MKTTTLFRKAAIAAFSLFIIFPGKASAGSGYVVNSQDDTVSVLNTTTNTVAGPPISLTNGGAVFHNSLLHSDHS